MSNNLSISPANINNLNILNGSLLVCCVSLSQIAEADSVKAAVQSAGKRKPYCQSINDFISASWVGSCCSTSSKKQASSELRTTIMWEFIFFFFNTAMPFSSWIILSLLPFREQASHCLQGHRVTAGPWWFNSAEVAGWWPEIKGGHRGAA